MRGVLLLYMGAPDSLESVQPFLYNIFSDRDIISLPFQKPLALVLSHIRAIKAKGKYRAIGGESPLLRITREQARALESRLGMEVFVGMRYWEPYIHEAVERIVADGIEQITALPLYPQYSRATTGSCFNELSRAIERRRIELKVDRVRSWHRERMFIDALAEKAEEKLGAMEEPEVIFSAHSMPLSLIEGGDPYQKEVEETAEALEGRLGIKAKLAYQSQGPGKWLTPRVEEVLERLAGKGAREVLVVPITFVSDHVETLYDIDIAFREKASRLGLRLERAQSLNNSKKFLLTLEKVVGSTSS